jgi:hypothetical protein
MHACSQKSALSSIHIWTVIGSKLWQFHIPYSILCIHFILNLTCTLFFCNMKGIRNMNMRSILRIHFILHLTYTLHITYYVYILYYKKDMQTSIHAHAHTHTHTQLSLSLSYLVCDAASHITKKDIQTRIAVLTVTPLAEMYMYMYVICKYVIWNVHVMCMKCTCNMQYEM